MLIRGGLGPCPRTPDLGGLLSCVTAAPSFLNPPSEAVLGDSRSFALTQRAGTCFLLYAPWGRTMPRGCLDSDSRWSSRHEGCSEMDASSHHPRGQPGVTRVGAERGTPEGNTQPFPSDTRLQPWWVLPCCRQAPGDSAQEPRHGGGAQGRGLGPTAHPRTKTFS